MKIVVLAGGLSTERDVSFKTGDMAAKSKRAGMGENRYEYGHFENHF